MNTQQLFALYEACDALEEDCRERQLGVEETYGHFLSSHPWTVKNRQDAAVAHRHIPISLPTRRTVGRATR